MHARSFHRVALAAAILSLGPTTAFAGGGGRGAGAVFRSGGGFHGAPGGQGGWRGHGGWGGGQRPGGPRAVPQVAGVIHERSGMRPYFSAYGHTDTAARWGGFARGGVPAYGQFATASPYRGGFRSHGAGDRPVVPEPRYGAQRRFEARGESRRRFAERDLVRRYGGFGGGYGFGDGTYGAPGLYGGTGVYGEQGTYGDQGSYGQPGSYGGAGLAATQDAYGTGGGAYRSETPLAARFAEPPLGPSPDAPYSPDDRYAYAAAGDVGPGPRVVNPYRGSQSGCACGARSQPAIYRYGIGTAY